MRKKNKTSWNPGQSGNPIGKLCSFCGELIICKSKRQWNRMKQFPNNNYYCSKDCYKMSMMDIYDVPVINCSNCGISLTITRKQYGKKKFRNQKNHFCSYACMSEYNANKRRKPLEERRLNWKNPNVLNGWEIMRLKSFIVDERGDICEICSTENTVTHHIKPVKLYPELIYKKENIILVCNDCHYKIHVNTGWNYLKDVPEYTMELYHNGI